MEWDPQSSQPTSRGALHDCPLAFGHHLPHLSEGRVDKDISAIVHHRRHGSERSAHQEVEWLVAIGD